MGLLLDVPFFCEVILGLLLLFITFYLSVVKNYTYWETKGVPFIEPSFPFGNTKDLLMGRKQLGEIYNDFYNKFKGERYFGVYEIRRPIFVVRDPQLIKHILTKDFNHFQNRFTISKSVNPKVDYLAKHLFNLEGQEWKHMRVKLSPTFTSGKIKTMFLLIEQCVEQLINHVNEQTDKNSVIDVKDVLARFTLDTIATCAFGLESNSLEDRDSEFYHYGVKIFHLSFARQIRRILFAVFPTIMKLSSIRLVSKDLTEFFTRVVRDTLEYREKNNVTRNDFLNLLIQVGQNKNSEKEEVNGNSENKAKVNTAFTVEEIAAQSFVFFAAGFETASSTMSFCLYELAQNPDIQDRLYEEIKETLSKHDGKPTYQTLQEMPYMDKVINETLRRYASLAVLNRVCTEKYKVPDSELVIEEGTNVVIPTFAIHHDPQFYPDPFKFDPERFSPERVRERHPYVHLPFGEGPRVCIGMRFGLLQTKIGLAYMLMNFEFGLTAQTQIPVPLSKTSFVTQPEKPILLQLTRRKSAVL
ncbi:cytochrome P450 6a8-like [Macrosteles quadrilineatus]|uniref:cytochrome P450 6a8-like n=1 Tax=Macrosteles quadrilineatus TaxID=74068 RepID=UPI0023E16B4B|nr:cytochrome P450 6a8-like [Macrosteles quadrilineatus]